MDFTPIEWEAHEYTHIEKSVDWFWAVGLIAVTLAIIAIILNNILFAVLIVIGTGALLLFSVRRPRIIDFAITKRGIQIDGQLFPYSTLESFWVEDRLFNDKLLIKSQKPMMPLLTLPIDGFDPDEMRETMSQFLPEEEHEDSFSHHMMEWLGF